MSGKIERVTLSKQGDVTLYTFPLPALRLVEIGKISRLHEQEGGVQRKLDENRAGNIALAMQDPTILWLDTFLVHMEPEGSWTYEDGVISYDDNFSLGIDDGQHRRYAMTTLTPAELERLGDLNITATFGLTFEQRLALFIQQENRKHLDSNLLLQGRNALGTWKTPLEKLAYEIVLNLAHDEGSALYGRIEVEEVTRSQVSTRANAKMTAVGLFNVVKMAIGRRSFLFQLPTEQQKDIIFRYLKIASNIWGDKWESQEDFIVSGGRGIGVLLRLFVISKSLRMFLAGDDFSDSRLRSALQLGARFDWGRERNKNRSDLEILNEFDQLMSRQYAHRKNQHVRDTTTKRPK